MKQKITPFLWFDDNAQEAMDFYTSVFPNSKITGTSPGPDGKMMTGTLEIGDQEFMVLNGGPLFKFTEAISLFVDCQGQEEVDDLWTKLTEGGEESQCGWLKDKFGLSWQIIPKDLGEMLTDPDPERAGRVMEAMLKMKKIEVAKLKEAYNAK